MTNISLLADEYEDLVTRRVARMINLRLLTVENFSKSRIVSSFENSAYYALSDHTDEIIGDKAFKLCSVFPFKFNLQT